MARIYAELITKNLKTVAQVPETVRAEAKKLAIQIYVEQIQKGSKMIDDVQKDLKAEVQAALDAAESSQA